MNQFRVIVEEMPGKTLTTGPSLSSPSPVPISISNNTGSSGYNGR